MTWQGENYCCEWIPKLAFQELSLCQSDEGWKLKTSAFFSLQIREFDPYLNLITHLMPSYSVSLQHQHRSSHSLQRNTWTHQKKTLKQLKSFFFNYTLTCIQKYLLYFYFLLFPQIAEKRATSCADVTQEDLTETLKNIANLMSS